ncbi:MAG: carboxymuconolactone decarboxylase family protein [Chromatiales bacterium]|nr:carboxymuconolactone decarboxylase family protein [Chromatiales bacterium]
MLTQRQQQAYEAFYATTHENEYLDTRTELLVGLAAAIALNCKPCTNYYLKQAQRAEIKRGEVAEVLAKVMAVSAGQKRLQTEEVLNRYRIELDDFTE